MREIKMEEGTQNEANNGYDLFKLWLEIVTCLIATMCLSGETLFSTFTEHRFHGSRLKRIEFEACTAAYLLMVLYLIIQNDSIGLLWR